MKKTLFLFSALIAFNFLLAQDVTTLRIDPDLASAGTAAQIFDSILFVPLETTKESLFGKIDQLEVTDSCFVILDYMSRSILLFDRSGAFHARIRTDAEDRYFSYFTLDRPRNEIIAAIGNEKKYLIYDLNGKLLRTESKPAEVTDFYCFDNHTFVLNLTRPADLSTRDKTGYDLAFSTGYDKIIKKALPYNLRFENFDYNLTENVFNYSGQPGSCMFALPFNYTVTQLNDTGIIHQYKFIFPASYSLPKNFATDSLYAGARSKYAYGTPENRGKYEGIEHVFRVGNYLLFTANYSGRFKNDKNFAYNLTNNDLVSFGRVVGDSTSDFLPLLSHRSLEEVNMVYKDQIFSAIPSVMLFNLKNNSKNPVKYREPLQKYFANGKRDDNVVMMVMTLKKDL